MNGSDALLREAAQRFLDTHPCASDGNSCPDQARLRAALDATPEPSSEPASTGLRPTVDLAALAESLAELNRMTAPSVMVRYRPLDGDLPWTATKELMTAITARGFEVRAAARPADGEEGLRDLWLAWMDDMTAENLQRFTERAAEVWLDRATALAAATKDDTDA